MDIKELLPGYCRHLYVISHWGRTLVFEANSITQMIRRRIEAPNNRCWLTPYQKPIFQQLLQKRQKHPKLWNESQPRNRPFDVLHFSIIGNHNTNNVNTPGYLNNICIILLQWNVFLFVYVKEHGNSETKVLGITLSRNLFSKHCYVMLILRTKACRPGFFLHLYFRLLPIDLFSSIYFWIIIKGEVFRTVRVYLERQTYKHLMLYYIHK